MLRKEHKKEYEIWKSMRQRCFNKKNKAYKNYGGRGIKICARWDSFENFIQDMGVKPEKLTLDRIDNNGNYEPKNCKWRTRKEQGRNKRNNRLINIGGKTKSLQEWSDEFEISSLLVFKRLKRGWDIRRSLTEKSNFGKYSKKVYQIKNNKIVKMFNSLSDAHRKGFNAAHICQCCKGIRPKHKGYIWKYA